MVIAIWIAALLVWALWTLGAWGLHALLSLDTARLGDLKPLIDQLPDKLPYATVIDAWLPGWREMLKIVIDLMQWVMGWIGSAGPAVVWGVWGVGTLMGLAFAGLATWVVRSLLREQAPIIKESTAPGNR